MSAIHKVRLRDRNVRYLTLGIGIEMNALPVCHTEEVACVGSAPSCERHTPPYSAVIPHLSVPSSVCGHHQGTAYRVNIWVGGGENNRGGEAFTITFSLAVFRSRGGNGQFLPFKHDVERVIYCRVHCLQPLFLHVSLKLVMWLKLPYVTKTDEFLQAVLAYFTTQPYL